MAVRGTCWYCGAADCELTDEHVLSEANFGGRLVAPKRVCGACNSAAGKLEREIVAGPFLAELAGRDGHLFGPRGLPRPMVTGVLPDRADVRVRFESSGARVIARTPRKIGEEKDGTEIWEASNADVDRVRQRRQSRGASVRVVGRDPSDAAGLNTSWGIGESNIDQWQRLAAKVALSLASLELNEAWLKTDGAHALQDVLHRRGVRHPMLGSNLSIMPSELTPGVDPLNLLRQGEHLLGLDRDHKGRPRAWMILFASLAYFIPLPDGDVPPSEPTWLLRPRADVLGPVSGADMRQRLTQRLTP